LGGGWQISAGDFADYLGPARLAFAALSSAWVLADSRRRTNRPRAALWTLATLLAPFVALPLYLALRLLSRPATDLSDTPDAVTADEPAAAPDAGAETHAGILEGEGGDETATDEEGRAGAAVDAADAVGVGERLAGRFKALAARWRESALPLAYAAALLALGSVYFALDWRSFDAHFARAKRAKLRGDAARTVREYRAALARRDDAHTHKLLGLELLREGRAEEALGEFRAAGRGAEPDDSLAFYEARALDALARPAEAAEAYGRFAAGALCGREPEDARCGAARERLPRP